MDTTSYKQHPRGTVDRLKSNRARSPEQLVEAHVARNDGLEQFEVGAATGRNLTQLARFGASDAIEVDECGHESIRARRIVCEAWSLLHSVQRRRPAMRDWPRDGAVEQLLAKPHQAGFRLNERGCRPPFGRCTGMGEREPASLCP